MFRIATTRMSSKGQVVIPEDIREQLGLEPGAQFVVLGDKDVIILKTIKPPSMKEFDQLVARARKQAKTAGIKKADLRDVIDEVRSEK